MLEGPMKLCTKYTIGLDNSATSELIHGLTACRRFLNTILVSQGFPKIMIALKVLR